MMKKALFSFCLFAMVVFSAHGQVKSGSDTINAYGASYQKPIFPGGQDSLNSFIRRNMHYPRGARESGIEGRVIITFMVTEQGDVTDIRLKRSPGGGCDEEAKRIVAAMPRWTPATYKGKPTKAVEWLPIIFKLE